MDTGTIVLLCVASAAVGFTAAYFITKPNATDILYATMYLDAALLQNLVNEKGFQSLELKTTKAAKDYYYLQPSVKPNDGSVKLDPALVSIRELSNAFPRGKNVTTYELTQGLKRIPFLLSWNSTGYFLLEPMEYRGDNSFISYQISAYTRAGVSIPPLEANDQGYEIDPCPPARPY